MPIAAINKHCNTGARKYEIGTDTWEISERREVHAIAQA